MGGKGSNSGKSGAGGSARELPTIEKSRQMNYKDVPFEEPELSPGKPTKDSEREFREAYNQAQSIVELQGYEDNWVLQNFVNYNVAGMDYSPQALKGIQQKINSEKSYINLAVKFNKITPEQATQRTQALSMVQKTLNNTVRSQREYDQRLRKKK